MRITQKDIKDHLKHTKQAWHDEKWWAYDKSKKAEAIYYALSIRQSGDSIRDLQDSAQKYLENNQ